jgi:hypothetical protein
MKRLVMGIMLAVVALVGVAASPAVANEGGGPCRGQSPGPCPW